jgi:outer membrane protein assembly factor BamB
LKWKTYNTYTPGGGFQSSPSVVNGVFYIGDVSHNLLAIDATNGNFLWVYSATGACFSQVLLLLIIQFISDVQMALYTLLMQLRYPEMELWDGGSIYGSPIVANGVLYVGQDISNGSYLYAIDANTGVLRWMYRSDNVLHSSPTVFNDVVYIGSLNNVLAVNAGNGTLRWKYVIPNINEEVLAGPCIVDRQGNIYVSGISGRQN